MRKIITFLVAVFLISFGFAYQAPYSLGKFNSILNVSKLTYPKPNKKVVDYGKFQGFASDWFYADENENLVFVLEKTEKDSKIRNELREGINGKNDGWDIQKNNIYHLHAKVKLQPISDLKEYTFLQIHSEKHPLLRMVVEKEKKGKTNHIWAVVRITTKDSGKRTQRFDLGPVNNDFTTIDIYAGNGKLVIKREGKTYVDKDVSYWPEKKNYFKAGIYDSKNSKGPWKVKIAFSELSIDNGNQTQLDNNSNYLQTNKIQNNQITSSIPVWKYQKMLNAGLNTTWAAFNKTKSNLTQQDIDNFKKIGFSTVRIRVTDDYKKLGFKSLNDYIPYIEKLVQMTEKAGLIPVLSFGNGILNKNPTKENEENAIQLREKFAQVFKGKYPNLSFDLLIEPGKELNKKYDVLLDFYTKVIPGIRKIDPNRILMIIGPSRGNPEYMYKFEQNPQLVKIMKTDKHLMIQFHFLAAGPFREGKKSSRNTGTEQEKQNIENRLKIAVDFGKKYNLPLWFGARMPGNYNHTYDKGDNNYTIEEQIKFATFFTSLLKRYHIPFAINADSQFYNYQTHQWNNRLPVVKAIIDTWYGSGNNYNSSQNKVISQSKSSTVKSNTSNNNISNSKKSDSYVNSVSSDQALKKAQQVIDEIVNSAINPWKEKIQNLQFQKLDLNLGKYLQYYKVFENYFNIKKQQILQNTKFQNEDYYLYLKSFNTYTNWIFTDIYYGNLQNIKSYLDSFKKVIKKLRQVK